MVTGALMHAAGHAFLAGAAGLLARTLARGAAPASMDAGSTPALPGSPAGASLGQAMVVLAALGTAAALLKLAGGALAAWAEAELAGAVAADVRLAALDGVLAVTGREACQACRAGERARRCDHGDTRAAQLAALTTHIHDVERGVSHGVLAELRALLQVAPLAALLALLAPRLAGSAVVALAAFGVFAFATRRAVKRANARAAREAERLVGAADEAVQHAELWATYGASTRIRAHVAAASRAIARETSRLRVRGAILSATSEVLGALALLLALLFAAGGGLGDDPGKVVPFAIVFFMAYRPLRELVDARLARARGDAALRQAVGRTDARREPEAAPAPARSWDVEPLVIDRLATIHGVHPPLSVVVPAGAIAVVVGDTGSGKTTLLRTLLGVVRPRAGRVFYGNAPGARLDEAGVGPAARPFAWVPQDAPVLADTLAVNVGLGADVESDPRAILAELGAEELAIALGDDPVGTSRPVSGGERQWIAVARALATRLPVLLLDEPTSALDDAAERRLLDALASLRGKRTVIIVTHRPAPLAIADLVIRLEPAKARRSGSGVDDVELRAGEDLDAASAE